MTDLAPVMPAAEPEPHEIGAALVSLAQSASYLMLDHNPKTRRLSHVLQDEAHVHLSFAQKCSLAGVTMDEAMDLYVRIQKMAGQVKVFEKLPRIMSGMAEDAISEWLSCPLCVPDQACGTPGCVGGLIRKSADPESRRMVAEMAGFVGAKGGPLVQIQNNSFSGGVPADVFLRELEAPQTIPRITTSSHKDIIHEAVLVDA